MDDNYIVLCFISIHSMKLYSKMRGNKTRVKIPFLSVTGTLCGAFT